MGKNKCKKVPKLYFGYYFDQLLAKMMRIFCSIEQGYCVARVKIITVSVE